MEVMLADHEVVKKEERKLSSILEDQADLGLMI